jgi:uncharacterized protein YndB with AHSA1/START domain
VRYADGPTAEASVEIDAPPDAVWALVTDLAVPAKFSDEYLGGEWLDGGSATAGARFVGRNRHSGTGREWSTESVVTECEPGVAFAWGVGETENPSASWRFELEALDGGRRTRLRQWARMGPGPSGLTPAIEARPDKEERIVERRLEEWTRNMEATVAGIKQLAES